MEDGNPIYDPDIAARYAGRVEKLLVGGAWVDPVAGGSFPVLDPATGKKIADVGQGGAEDIDRAVEAARAAFTDRAWAELSGAARSALLFKLADLIEENANELASIECIGIGNPVTSIATVDIGAAVGILRSTAGYADKITGIVPMTAGAADGMCYVVREPVGVIGAITPWNAPFLMALGKIGPALAMGCTVVLKPPELSPLSSLRLGALVEQAGFPAGVVNIVTGLGSEAGRALAEHRYVNKISFTGSTHVGREILAAAGGNMKRVTLELGGKSPVVVMPDADLDAAAAAIAREICFKAGQYCAAGTRLLVAAAVHDALVDKIRALMEQVKIASGFETGAQMGPLISQGQVDRVLGYISSAVADGATIITGGRRVPRPGFFVEPTLIAGVTRAMRVFHEEIFGPVLCVSRLDDTASLAAVAAVANDSEYGLGAKIWTRDIAVAHGLARRIQAGTIIINGGGPAARLPLGGFKMSGVGREGGLEGMHAFTELKSISMAF